jgi:hypothetical protein
MLLYYEGRKNEAIDCAERAVAEAEPWTIRRRLRMRIS